MDLVFRGDDAFSDVIGGRALFFNDLSSGETAVRPFDFSGRECGGGKASPADKSLKRPARETQTEEKGIITLTILL
jgi:hypothetical protein